MMYAFPRLGARFGTERLLVLGAVAVALRAFLAAVAAVLGPRGDRIGKPFEPAVRPTTPD